MLVEQGASGSPDARRGRRASCAIPIHQLLEEAASSSATQPVEATSPSANRLRPDMLGEKLRSLRAAATTARLRLRSAVMPSRHAATSEATAGRSRPMVLISLSALFGLSLILISMVANAESSPPLVINHANPAPAKIESAPPAPPAPVPSVAAEPVRSTHSDKQDRSHGSAAHSPRNSSSKDVETDTADKIARDLTRQWFGSAGPGR